MKKIAVIGLNNFGLEIARQLTLSGTSVMAIDRDRLSIDKISGDVDNTLFIGTQAISELQHVKFDTFDEIVLIMNGNPDLAFASLILLKSLMAKNIVICMENNDQEQIASMFSDNLHWQLVRLDKLMAETVKNMLDNKSG